MSLRHLQWRARQERSLPVCRTGNSRFARAAHVQAQDARQSRDAGRQLRHSNYLYRRSFHRHLRLRPSPQHLPLCRMCESLPGRDRLGFSSEGTLLVLDVRASKPIWRRPFLDGLWASNARAYHRLAPFGSAAGAGFLVLGAALVIAGRGWFLRRFWGWGLAAALCGDPDRGKRGERHPGPFLGGGNRVDSCGRDTLFSFASASANCFPQEGFSRARNSLSLYLYLIHLSRESSGISPRVWGYFAR